jgi:phage gp29-like protein
LQFGNYTLQSPFRKTYETDVIEHKEENPSAYSGEVSSADSSYYDPYQLRPYNPAELYQKKGDYSLYDLILEDDQVSAVLSLKKIITLSSGWEIESEDQAIVDFVTWCFTDLIEKTDDTFVKKLYEILSAIDYGNSVTEIIADPVTYEGSTKIGITCLKTRAPHSIEFHQDAKGNLVELRQDSGTGYNALPPEKFIIYTYQKKFDNLYGQSEINKGVYRAWWSKEAIIKFWNIFLERHGSPTPVVKLPRNAGVQEKERVKQIIKNWQTKTGISFPEDFEIELLKVDSGQASAGFEKAIDKYNTMIARRMLIPDLMGLSGGETKGGSYALGEKQFDILMTVIGYIRQDVERLINKHLVSKLVMWNFGSK